METVLYTLYQLGQILGSDVHPSGYKAYGSVVPSSVESKGATYASLLELTTGCTANTEYCSCCRND